MAERTPVSMLQRRKLRPRQGMTRSLPLTSGWPNPNGGCRKQDSRGNISRSAVLPFHFLPALSNSEAKPGLA